MNTIPAFRDDGQCSEKLMYLDMCCFNRPYDDQTQTRIRLETEAKLILQQHIRSGTCHLVWSAVLDYECSRNPFPEHKFAILQWRQLADRYVAADVSVVASAMQYAQQGMGQYDALHVASALAGQSDIFTTTDDRLLKKIRNLTAMSAALPTEALALLENWYEN